MRRPHFFLLVFACVAFTGQAQTVSSETLREHVQAWKAEALGPYARVQWFCEDGTTTIAEQGCDTISGLLHAVLKTEGQQLAKSNHLFLGQMLSSADVAELWDEPHDHSRLKQYLLGQYARDQQDGWIWDKAQYAENTRFMEAEADAGRAFLLWMLEQDTIVERQFYLVRELVEHLPHETTRLQEGVYAKAIAIAVDIPDFFPLRNKLLGWPQSNDVHRVEVFKKRLVEEGFTDTSGLAQLDSLQSLLEAFYAPKTLASLADKIEGLPEGMPLRAACQQLVRRFGNSGPTLEKLGLISSMMWRIRTSVPQQRGAETRLALLDLSAELEAVLQADLVHLSHEGIDRRLRLIPLLAQAAAACGELEMWEWEHAAPRLRLENAPRNVRTLYGYVNTSRQITHWGAGRVIQTYQRVSNQYQAFDPLAGAFGSVKLMSSMSAWLGLEVTHIERFLAKQVDLKHALPSDIEADIALGMVTGATVGTLADTSNTPTTSGQRIYLLDHSRPLPDDASGIVITGDISWASTLLIDAIHREIPVAFVSEETGQKLEAHLDEPFLFLVTEYGHVTLLPKWEWTAEQQSVISEKEGASATRSQPKQSNYQANHKPLVISDIKISENPSSHNENIKQYVQWMQEHPAYVADGVIIPAGAFRKHLDQPVPGRQQSYWQALGELHRTARGMIGYGSPETVVKAYLDKELAELTESLRSVALSASFMLELQQAFERAFKQRLGTHPVLLHAHKETASTLDWNPDQAVLSTEQIAQGVRDLWANSILAEDVAWNPQQLNPAILITPALTYSKHATVTRDAASKNARISVKLLRDHGTPTEMEHVHLLPDGTLELIRAFRGRLALEQPLLSPSEQNEITQLAGNLDNTPAPSFWELEIGMTDKDVLLLNAQLKQRDGPQLLLFEQPKPNLEQAIPLR